MRATYWGVCGEVSGFNKVLILWILQTNVFLMKKVSNNFGVVVQPYITLDEPAGGYASLDLAAARHLACAAPSSSQPPSTSVPRSPFPDTRHSAQHQNPQSAHSPTNLTVASPLIVAAVHKKKQQRFNRSPTEEPTTSTMGSSSTATPLL